MDNTTKAHIPEAGLEGLHTSDGRCVQLVGNGRRVYLAGKLLAIQDLHDGHLAELPVRRIKHPDFGTLAVVGGGMKTIAKHPWLANVPGIERTAGKKGQIVVSVLADFLTFGDRKAPPFPVPTIAQMRRVAGYRLESDEQLQAIAAVVSAIASRRAGKATEDYLRRRLRKRFDRKVVDEVLSTAVWVGRIGRRFKGGDTYYWMPADWDWAIRAIPGVTAPAGTTTVVSSGLFDGEEDE